VLGISSARLEKETGTFNWGVRRLEERRVSTLRASLPIRKPARESELPPSGAPVNGSGRGFVPGDLSAADVHPRANTIALDGLVSANGRFAGGFFHKTGTTSSRRASLHPTASTPTDPSIACNPSVIESERSSASGGQTPADIINAMEDCRHCRPRWCAARETRWAAVVERRRADVSAAGGAHDLADMGWRLVSGAAAFPVRTAATAVATGSYEQGPTRWRSWTTCIHDWTHCRCSDPMADSGRSTGQLAGHQPDQRCAARHRASAYDGGWEGYLQRSMQAGRLAGATTPVFPELLRERQPGGLPDCPPDGRCRGTVDALTSLYGSSDPASWTCKPLEPVGGVAQPAAVRLQGVECNPVPR